MQGGGPVAVLLSPRWSGFKLGFKLEGRKGTVRGVVPNYFLDF
jgi:hypothetical protein